MSQTLTRLLPPIAVQQQIIVANGRTYSSTPGHVVDVLDFDATVLTANGWLRVAQSGTTAQRPTSSQGNGFSAAPGTPFYDMTVGALLIFDGAAWRSPTAVGELTFASTGPLSSPEANS
jgi:hypothetical protein